MAEEKTYVFGDGSNATVPAWLAYGNGNGGWGNGFGGWGGGILGFFLGLLFGNGGFGGWGNGFGGFGGRGAGYLANQMNNDNNTDLLMNAINGTDSDVRLLATTLNADVNEVRSALSVLTNSITTLSGQTGLGFQQVVNSIQSGDASLSRQLCECCCENRLLTTQQGYESRIQTLEQTNQLGSQADRNTRSITDAINAQTVAMDNQFCALKERELQSKIDTQADIITQLRGQIDNANQTAAITGYVNSIIAPLQKQVTEIANKIPNTVPVQYPNLVAVNNTPYTGGAGYGYGIGYGNGLVF